MKKRVIGLLSLLSFTILGTSISHSAPKIEPNLMTEVNKQKMNQWVDSVFNNMTIDERIGQMIVIHVGGENTAANKQKITNLVKNYHAGGVLFSKGTPANQVDLTNTAQKNAKVPLMITFDGEWGLSMRLSNTTRFPKNMMLGAIQDLSLLNTYGQEMARQCKVMGIQVNFAPDMDVNSNPSNPVIGVRSYGEDPKRVAQLGIAYSKGLEAGGVMSTAKHFPGHGGTSTDSHKTLPLISHSKQRLNDVELIPFKEYIDAKLSGIMVGHLNIPSLDNSGQPSSLSKAVITDLLQDELGFTGLIFTDGLAMQGVANEKDMSLKAILAGNDILLGPVNPINEFNALKKAFQDGRISEPIINTRVKKILAYKYILGLRDAQYVDPTNLLDRINTPEAEWINRKLNEKAITLVSNKDNILPLKSLDKQSIAAVSIGSSVNNNFHKTLKLYDNIDCFNVATADGLSAIQSKLSKYSTIIVSVHNNKATNQVAIQNVIRGKKSILTFFTLPYTISKYATVVNNTSAVVVGYEDTPFAQEYAAQGIFGGNPIEGKLPVSVKGIYSVGDGINTAKTRLSYNMPEEVGVSSYRLANIDKIAKEGIAEQAYPGCQILVAKDGVVIYNKSFGTFDYKTKKEVENDDIYDIASMSKAIGTLPAIMKLYDDKKIKLQEPISQYVPQLRGTDKSDITIRQALFHETGITSFIQYYLPAINTESYSGRLFNANRSEIHDAFVDNGAWGRTDYRFNPNLVSSVPKNGFSRQVAEGLYVHDSFGDIIVQSIADSKLRANKRYLYSCLNFMLLKEVIEDASKTDLSNFLQKNFYEKLGAYTTTFNPLKKFSKDRIVPTEQDNFLRKQLIQGFVHDEGAAFMGGVSGNAGLFSDANDIAKICQMWLNQGSYGDERYLSKATTQLFTSTKSGNSRRGLGLDKPDMDKPRSSPTSPSAPISTYGHTGFTGTCFWIDPENKLIYIFLSNRINESRSQKKLMSLNIRPRIQEEIYKAIK